MRRSASGLLVLATALIATSVGLVVGALGTVLPTLHAHLHAPLDQLGLLFGANFAGSIVVTLGLGRIMDRSSGRGLLVCGTAVMILGLALVPFASNLLQALAAMILMGIGSGASSVGSPVLMSRLFGPQSSRALSLINGAFGLGAFAGPLLAAAVLQRTHEYSPIFFGVAALVMIPLLIFVLVPLPALQRSPSAALPRVPKSLLSSIALLGAVGFLYLGAEVGYGGWIFTFVRQTTNANISTASYAPAAYWLALSVGSLVAIVRPTAISARLLTLLCCSGATLVALAMLPARGAVLPEILTAALIGLFLGPIYPLNLAEAAALTAESAGRITGLVASAGQVGGTVLPWVQGLLLAKGPSWGIVLTLSACCAMAILQAIFMRHHTSAPITSIS